MKVDRAVLVKALDTVKPAVATKALLEELSHVWFDEKHLMAYDDILGIRTPFAEPGLKGGLRGSLMMGLLNASGAKQVEVIPSENGNEALLKAARAKLKLAMLSTERAVFSFPKTGKKSFPLTPELLAAMEKVMLAVGEDTSVPDQLGISFALAEDGLSLYSTDSKTLACATLEAPKGYEEEYVVLPTPFCEQVLRLCKGGATLSFVKDGGVIAEGKDGVGIFSRLLDITTPLDFAGQLANVLPKGYMKKVVPIPPRLKLAIERALVVLNGKVGEPVDLFVAGGVLNMHAKSEIGELKDSIPLEKEHADVRLKVDPLLLKRALDRTDSMLITETCVGMFGGSNFTYLTSSVDR